MKADPDRILVIRLSAVGDVLLATPTAAWLRRRYRAAELIWLVDAGCEDLLTGNPDVDRVQLFDFTGRHRGPAGIRRLAEELRPIDLLVDLQHKLRTSLLQTWLRAPDRRVLVKRRGLDVVRAMVGRDTILRGPHQVERNLALVGAAIGSGDDPADAWPKLSPDPQRVARARECLGALAGDRPIVGLVPATRHATKLWPAEYQQRLIRRCLQADLAVVLLGGPEDTARAASLARAFPGAPLAAITDGALADLSALLSLCALVVSPDTGPAHMAAALQVPTLALFGPTSPERWAPRGPRVEVLRVDLPCSPCSNHGQASCPLGTLECMRRLEPERVWHSVARWLGIEGAS